MDHNEHVIQGNLGKALADRDGLDLWEADLQHTGDSPGATFFRGSKPIDGIWISSDIDISNVCVIPFGYDVGDHCAFILDIPIESLVGINPVKIGRPASRQLNSKLPGCSKAYITVSKTISRGTGCSNIYMMHTLADTWQRRKHGG
jgi:hypothetical protein